MGGGLSTACSVRQRRGRWFLCVDDDQKKQFERVSDTVGPERIEELLRELFRMHDLNKNGLLEEAELIKVNEKIEILHKGEDLNKEEVKEKYRTFFREKLDPDGRPVTYEVFRAYWTHVLNAIDRDLRVQEMTLEQCVAEVESARQAFFIPDFHSKSDMPYMLTISCHGALPFPSLSQSEFQCQSQTQGLSPPTLRSSAPSSGLGPATPAFPATPEHTPLGGSEDARACGFSGGSCESFDSEFIPTPSLGDHSSFREAQAPPASAAASAASASLARQFQSCLSVDSDFVPSPSLAESRELHSSGSHLQSHPPLPSNTLLGSQVFSGSASLQQREGTELTTETLPQQTGTPGPGSGSVLGYAKGERVEAWSNSKGAWMEAVVLDTFPEQSLDEGYTMPAGTVKVLYVSGTRKWIRPEEVASQLRKTTAAARGPVPATGPGHAHTHAQAFTKDSRVQVWSDTRGAWLPGIVEEAYTEATRSGGYSIPAGTVKVSSAAGLKYVQPEHITRTLRPEPSSTLMPFAKGEHIEVWSDSKQRWLGGIVEQVFPTTAMSDGFWVPAGSVKVSSEAGVKWVSPGRTAQTLRKAGAVAGTGTGTGTALAGTGAGVGAGSGIGSGIGSAAPAIPDQSLLANALRDPEILTRHVDAVWAAAGCGPGRGLPKDRAPWVLEGLAMQFDVQLDLEGRHLSQLQKRLEAFEGDAEGCLTRAEFHQLSQGIVTDVVRSL